MNRNDGFGSRATRFFEPGRVHRVSALINIDKHGPSSTIGNRLGRGQECIRYSYDFIAGTDAPGQKRKPERFGSAANTNGVVAAAKRRKLLFEFLNKRAAGKSGAVNHLADDALKLPPQACMVSIKIEKWYANMHFFDEASTIR